MSTDFHSHARREFLTDTAYYFLDKKDLYLEIKDEISLETEVPLSMIRVCGSAYWGRSFSAGRNFLPGESDLDVALVDERLYVRSLTEVRNITKNYSNLTYFRSGPTSPNIFQEYAFKKGIIRTDVMPSTSLKLKLDAISAKISKKYIDHFAKITFLIYDSETSFTVKQIRPTKKFKEAGK